jgi:predicted PurR-regulated permease PerM
MIPSSSASLPRDPVPPAYADKVAVLDGSQVRYWGDRAPSNINAFPAEKWAQVKATRPYLLNFLIWTILIAPIDNVLKPILLGRGVDVPMLVIFVGAIGGFLSSGIIGLFLGAVVLALGYKLFLTWLKHDDLIADTPD